MNEKELIKKINYLREEASKQGIDIHEEIQRLEKKIDAVHLIEEIEPVSEDAWSCVKQSRLLERPKAQDIVAGLVTDFIELHGDRNYGDDPAILGGIAFFGEIPVTIIATRKGKNLKENQLYNFGMPQAEGYRKALRLVKEAARFNRPVLFIIDTPGAYPGIEAEERGIAEAIARNLLEFSAIPSPMIAVITGEGGSGGALALAVCDRIYMLENAIFSVISPEGCASILFKDPSKAPQAAQSLHLTALALKKLNLIDAIIEEGPGIDVNAEIGMLNLKEQIAADLKILRELPPDQLIAQRYQKYRQVGSYSHLELPQPRLTLWKKLTAWFWKKIKKLLFKTTQ